MAGIQKFDIAAFDSLQKTLKIYGAQNFKTLLGPELDL